MNNVSNPYPRDVFRFQLNPGASVGQTSIAASHICRDPQTGAVQPQRIFEKIFINGNQLKTTHNNVEARRVFEGLREIRGSLSCQALGKQLLVSTSLLPRQS